MRLVLAALDAGAAARPVLETALRIAPLTGASVRALHVDEGASEVPRSLAARCAVRVHVATGPVVPTLLSATASPEVVAAVAGARGISAGRRPVGHTALQIVEQVDKPVVVVPPDLVGREEPIRTLLLPLEGSEESSLPITERLGSLVVTDVDLIVLHVFTRETMPPILDRPVRDLQLWSDEFCARYGPKGAPVEIRTGMVGDQVAGVAADNAVDMVVLSWSQDASPGHAEVVREVISRSVIPVLLLPAVGAARTSGRSSGWHSAPAFRTVERQGNYD